MRLHSLHISFCFWKLVKLDPYTPMLIPSETVIISLSVSYYVAHRSSVNFF
ncbi:unnamed protein product [Brassica rapa subsp. trilocularis]